MGKESKIDFEYNIVIKEALTAYINKQYKLAYELYNSALILANRTTKSLLEKYLLNYMICCCILESSTVEDFSKAVNIIETINDDLKNKFPNFYYLLAQFLHKLNRFDEAIPILNHIMKLIIINPVLETFYIPGSTIPITNYLKKENFEAFKKKCSIRQQPDAFCGLSECNDMTAPYITRKKNIYFNDPCFTGLVRISCNNKNQPCLLQYHQDCWKTLKSQLCPIKKVSDKDILGNKCFTSDCKNNNTLCKISSIEIIGSNGLTKSIIESHIYSLGANHKNDSKGAVRKIPIKKKNDESLTVTSKMQSLEISSKESFSNRFTRYDENQTLALKMNAPTISFINETKEEVKNEKNFLYSFFLQYIEKNVVRISDLYDKFNELRQDLQFLRDIDILSFLLETDTFYVIEKPNESRFKKQEQEKAQDLINWVCNSKVPYYYASQGLDTLYDDMINDNDEDDLFHDEINDTVYNFCNDKKTKVFFDSKADKIHYLNLTKVNKIENSSCYSNNYQEIKNQKLKEYVSLLENKLDKIIKESESLKEDSKKKDGELKSLKQDQNKLGQKIEEIECRLQNFKKRYNNIKFENINIKKECIHLLEKKKSLVELLKKINNPDYKRQELLKTFKEEFKIFEDCVRAEEKKKLKILEQQIQSKSETNKNLVHKIIDLQHMKNSQSINESLELCKLRLVVIKEITDWFEKKLNITYVKDQTKCIDWLHKIREVSIESQNIYTKIKEELKFSENVNLINFETKLSRISFIIPNTNDLENIVVDALNMCLNHCQFIHDVSVKSLVKSQVPYPIDSSTFLQCLEPYIKSTSFSVPLPITPGIPLIECDKGFHISEFLGSNSDLDVANKILKNSMKETDENYLPSQMSKPYNIKSSQNHLMKFTCVSSNTSIIFTNTSKKKPMKKVGMNALIKLLHKVYPGSLENDVMEIIYEIRKNHNNSLNGLPLKQVLEEARELYTIYQQIHMLKYFMNDGDKSMCSESCN